MPTTIGVRELKNQASRIVRAVREEMAEYVITLQGKPVAVLRPFTDEDSQRLRQAEIDEALAEMKTLARQVGEAWKSPKSGVELVEEGRIGNVSPLPGLAQNPKLVQIINLLTRRLLKSRDQIVGVGDAIAVCLQVGL